MPQILRRRNNPQRAGGLCLILLWDLGYRTSMTMTLAASLLWNYGPRRLRCRLEAGGVARRSPRVCSWKRTERIFGSGRDQPSAVEMLRMVVAFLGPTAPSTRYIVNHLLFNS